MGKRYVKRAVPIQTESVSCSADSRASSLSHLRSFRAPEEGIGERVSVIPRPPPSFSSSPFASAPPPGVPPQSVGPEAVGFRPPTRPFTDQCELSLFLLQG
ncbi:hypothetical protein F2Q68_00018161 [Brassica cretica]|uniref:Uncharacterized protein n=1 Tax=Brassica cretica TaxID=69181 RepID=A0A8S9HFV1_BRACR|nr:hypothetical protein F2Q68_00018161 [Brassica cretica]